MDLKLNDKKALVLSASKGIGKGLALALSKEGCEVIICSSNLDNLALAKKEIEENSNNKIFTYQMDLSSEESVNKACKKIHDEHQGVDILITNSPGPKPVSAMNLKNSDLNIAMQVNFFSVVQLCNHFLPKMIENKFGRIINLSSTTAREPEAGMILSNVSRAAVISYSKTLSKELSKYGITFNSILTGGVLTDRTHNLLKMEAEVQGISIEKIYKNASDNIPAGYIPTPEEFAYSIVYLCSPLSSNINGVNLPIDGGLMNAL